MQWSKAGRSDSTLVVAVSNSELLTKGPQWCFWQCDRASWRVWSSPVHLPEWTGMYLGIFVHSLNEHFSIGANIKNISMQFFVIIPIFFSVYSDWSYKIHTVQIHRLSLFIHLQNTCSFSARNSHNLSHLSGVTLISARAKQTCWITGEKRKKRK